MKASGSMRTEGMTLFEVLLALAVFGVAALALAKTIKLMGDMTVESRQIRRVEQGLESLMDEYAKMPVLQELVEDFEADARGVRYRIAIEPVTDLYNQEGRALQGFFRITAGASWGDGGQAMEMSAQTLRYAGAFLPLGSAPIPINQPPLQPNPGVPPNQ